jgi:hypothetical protein
MELLRTINDLTSNKPRYWGKIGKRMVFGPVMGTALKCRFGTADNNDVIEIHGHIANLEITEGKISHINELQATMYKPCIAVTLLKISFSQN